MTPRNFFGVDSEQEAIAETLKVISSTVVFSFQCSDWACLGCACERSWGLLNVVSILIKKISSQPKIYHSNLAVLYSEIVSFDIFMDHLRLFMQILNRIEHP